MRNEIYELKDPKLPFYFHYTKLNTGNTIGVANWHEDIEILYFTEGTASVISGGKHIHAQAGDIVVINSNETHSMVAESITSFYCLIVFSAFCKANYFDITKDCFQSLIQNTEAISLLEELASIFCIDKNSINRFGMTVPQMTITKTDQILRIRSIVLRFMSILYQNYQLPTAEFNALPLRHEKIKQAITYIRSNCEHDISLDEISKLIGISKYYFSAEFKKITGYSFVSFLNLSRCEKAKSLLETTSMPISEICAQCGFTDPSYFTRVFANLIGKSPSAYRKSKQRSQSAEPQ